MSRMLPNSRVFSGIQPSGYIHLGNYLGAVQNWTTLQDRADVDRFYCIVDMHSITQKFIGKSDDDLSLLANFSSEPKTNELTLKTAATLLACGIDPKKSTLFVQSHVSGHAELMWMFACMTPLSWLNKMTQFKEKKSSSANTSLGLFAYPCLMAADILLYRANLVPVGDDQTQHLELSRDLAERFNRFFSPEEEFFVLPEKLKTNHHRVMSLQDATKKMSKSDPVKRSCINIIDDAEMIRLKITKAKTDSLGKIRYDETRPELCNLIRIYAALEDSNPKEIDSKFVGDNMFTFKNKLADKLIDKICPIGEKAMKLIEKEDYLLEVLHEGAKKAQEISDKNLNDIKGKLGILKRNASS